MNKLKVGIAGFGIVGKRRFEYIKSHPNLEVVAVCDQNYTIDGDENGVMCFTNYNKLLLLDLDILFVCLPNDIAPIVTIAGLKKGFHVFCEKPPGKSVEDILSVIFEEKIHNNLKLMYGFNHRYHDSVKMALSIIKNKELGDIINIRGVYGKSKIVSFKNGWRSERNISGGGILLDQGIHMVDLIRLFCGEFQDIKSFISNDYWKHDVEDNAYAIMKNNKGIVAMLNSTATQWQHKFNLEITLTDGYMELHGILSGSKSYGEEEIIIGKRDEDSENGQMEVRKIKYLQDNSWKDEIYYFAECVINNKPILNGSSDDALKTMQLVYQIYFQDEEWRNKYNISNPFKSS
jgi:predicted dehydrogenase